MKINRTILFSAFALLTSCEGFKSITGTIISEQTGKSIPNAQVNVLNELGPSTKTDSLGKYKIDSHLIGMMFGGPKFELEIKKDNYQTRLIKTKFGQDTIRLKDK